MFDASEWRLAPVNSNKKTRYLPDSIRFLRLWEMKRGASNVPSRESFDFDDFLPWMGRVSIMEVLTGGADFRYRLYGTTLAEVMGEDLTGKYVRNITRPDGDRYLRRLQEIATRRNPLVFSGECFWRARNITLRYEEVLCPVSGGAGDVSKIIGVTSFFTEQAGTAFAVRI